MEAGEGSGHKEHPRVKTVQVVGRKVWGCSRRHLWLVSMLKRRQSMGNWRGASSEAKRQGERIMLSKHSALLRDGI